MIALAIVLVLNYIGVRIAVGAMLTFAAVSFVPMLILAVVIVAKGGADGISLREAITNAASEGLNSKIQTIKKMAYGFRNRDHFKTAIYFHCGGLDRYSHETPGKPELEFWGDVPIAVEFED